MNEFIEFLTSKEIIVVYLVTGLACLLCFIIYMFEKNNEKLRRRHNTRELNKLVEQVKEEVKIENTQEVIYEQPVMQPMAVSTNEASSVIELLESTDEIKKIENEEVVSKILEPTSIEPVIISSIQVKEEIEQLEIEQLEVEEELPTTEIKKEVELQYTSIEPDQKTARLELEKLTAELMKQEKEEENIALTNYEEEQEENAIISLEELVKKSKEMYAANELSQYADEGNEPISLQDLERKMGEVRNSVYDEPFIIENVVPKEELEVQKPEIIETARPTVVLQDLNTAKVEVSKETVTPTKRFQSSPIISPIYGIEKQNNTSGNDLELENTANYEKLDEEIKRTNEFLMTLKELQRKLD